MIRHFVFMIFVCCSASQVVAFEYSTNNDAANLKATIGSLRDVRCQKEPVELQLVCYVWYRKADRLADYIMFLQRGHQLAASAGSEIMLNHLEQEIDETYRDLHHLIDHGFVTYEVLHNRSPFD